MMDHYKLIAMFFILIEIMVSQEEKICLTYKLTNIFYSFIHEETFKLVHWEAIQIQLIGKNILKKKVQIEVLHNTNCGSVSRLENNTLQDNCHK